VPARAASRAPNGRHVDDARDAGGGIEHVLGAADVDFEHRIALGARDADLVPRSDVEHRVAAADAVAERAAVRDVAVDDVRAAEIDVVASDGRDDLVPAVEQLLRQPAAEKSRRAGDEDLHFMRSATSCATSVGVVPTSMPRASSASFFACAVPDEPEMIAPA
jgi:hypothetical protein